MILKAGEFATITNGPSKFDLATAFTNRFGRGSADKSPQLTVKLTCRVRATEGKCLPTGPDFIAEVVIDSLGWEDGSGHGWIIEGRLTKSSEIQLTALRGKLAPSAIKCYYSSKSHQGWITSK